MPLLKTHVRDDEDYAIAGFDWMEPLALDQYWSQSGPLWVDLGAGKGGFLAEVAAAFPEYRFFGVERQLVRIRKMNRKMNRLGLTNVRLLRAEIYYTTRFLLPASSVDGFFLLFPDPWPKARHAKNRLVTTEFLDAMAAALKPNGMVHFATDNEPYLEWAFERWASHPGFQMLETVPVQMLVAETDFEKLWRSKGLDIHRLAFQKKPKTGNGG
jgi:tRNA (guanine-N7-)-methyltransferase